MKFLSSEVALYLHKCTIQSAMELSAASVQPLAHRRNLANLEVFSIGITLVAVRLNYVN